MIILITDMPGYSVIDARKTLLGHIREKPKGHMLTVNYLIDDFNASCNNDDFHDIIGPTQVQLGECVYGVITLLVKNGEMSVHRDGFRYVGNYEED